MAITIRRYETADADTVSDFFNRDHYGPIENGIEATGAMLRATFEERVLVTMMLAFDGDTLVGTLGFFRVSIRQALPESQICVANLFVAKRHRSTKLTGQLYSAAIRDMATSGLWTVRIDVNPNNVIATSTYLRIGFVAIDHRPSEQHGRFTLLNFLPGIIFQLMQIDPSYPWADAISSTAWRALPPSTVSAEQRKKELEDGTVRYELKGGGRSVSVLLDLEQGHPTEMSVDGQPFEPWPYQDMAAPAQRLPELIKKVSETVTARLDQEDGTLWIDVDEHLGPVLVDRFPTDSAAFSWCYRQAPQRETTIVELDNGWLTSREHNGWILSREITIDSAEVRVQVELQPNPSYVPPMIDPPAAPTQVFSLPKVMLRNAFFSGPYESGTDPQYSYLLLGRTPREDMDYEVGSSTLAPPRNLDDVETSWTSPYSGISLRARYSGFGAPRFEGGSLPGIVGEPTKPFGYRISVDHQKPAHPEVNSRFSSAPSFPSSAGHLPRWASVTAARQSALRADELGHRIDVIDNRGIAKWHCEGSAVLQSPFPGRRTWRCAQNWRYGAWWTRQGPRESLTQGIEWGDEEVNARLEIPNGSEHFADDQDPYVSWRIALAERYLEIAGQSAAMADPHELALVFTPRAARSGQILLGLNPGAPDEYPRESYDWQGNVNRIGIALQDGRWFVLKPIWARDPEIFIRSTAEGVRLHALSRVEADMSGDARWAIEVTQSIEEASRLLTL